MLRIFLTMLIIQTHGEITVRFSDGEYGVYDTTEPIFEISKVLRIKLERWNKDNEIDFNTQKKETFEIVRTLLVNKPDVLLDINVLIDILYLLDYLFLDESEDKKITVDLIYSNLGAKILEDIIRDDFGYSDVQLQELRLYKKDLQRLYSKGIEIIDKYYSVIFNEDSAFLSKNKIFHRVNLSDVLIFNYKNPKFSFNVRLYKTSVWFVKALNLSYLTYQCLYSVEVAIFDTESDRIENILHEISKNNRIYNLSISDLPISQSDFSMIYSLQSIRKLEFFNLKIRTEYLNSIYKLNNLENLYISGQEINSIQIMYYKKCRSLRTINLENCHMKSLNFVIYDCLETKTIEKSNLKFTSLRCTFDYDFLKYLDEFTDIKLINSDLNKCKLIYLFNIQSLMYLDISDCRLSGAKFKGPLNLPNLIYLNLTNNRITLEMVSMISKLKNIEELVLDNCGLPKYGKNSLF
ncbi:hypothetical protein P3W45_001425 [Vairimorpha bombi]